MSTEELQKRVARLADIEKIKNLKARYCAYCDDNYDADGIASLFIEDGIFDGGLSRPVSKGREAVRQRFQGDPERIPFAVHMVMNPIIEVDGNTAKGSWYLFQTCTFSEGNQAVWGSARYDDEYVKIDGEWMFKRVTLTPHFWTPFEKGWVEQRFL